MKSRIAIVFLCIALLIGCMPVSAVPAAVTPYYGDVNRDGSSDAADALLVLQNSVGLAGLTLDQQARADVNMDIKIDAADALRRLAAIGGTDYGFFGRGRGDFHQRSTRTPTRRPMRRACRASPSTAL